MAGIRAAPLKRARRLHGGNFGFDVHMRLSSADIGDISLVNFALLDGFNWH